MPDEKTTITFLKALLQQAGFDFFNWQNLLAQNHEMIKTILPDRAFALCIFKIDPENFILAVIQYGTFWRPQKVPLAFCIKLNRRELPAEYRNISHNFYYHSGNFHKEISYGYSNLDFQFFMQIHDDDYIFDFHCASLDADIKSEEVEFKNRRYRLSYSCQGRSIVSFRQRLQKQMPTTATMLEQRTDSLMIFADPMTRYKNYKPVDRIKRSYLP